MTYRYFDVRVELQDALGSDAEFSFRAYADTAAKAIGQAPDMLHSYGIPASCVKAIWTLDEDD